VILGLGSRAYWWGTWTLTAFYLAVKEKVEALTMHTVKKHKRFLCMWPIFMFTSVFSHLKPSGNYMHHLL
jgi:hypothetical protein